MNTDRIAEFRDAADARAFAKSCGPEYCVCPGIGMPWAVRQATHEEQSILWRSIPGTLGHREEGPDSAPSHRTFDDEPGDDL